MGTGPRSAKTVQSGSQELRVHLRLNISVPRAMFIPVEMFLLHVYQRRATSLPLSWVILGMRHLKNDWLHVRLTIPRRWISPDAHFSACTPISRPQMQLYLNVASFPHSCEIVRCSVLTTTVALD